MTAATERLKVLASSPKNERIIGEAEMVDVADFWNMINDSDFLARLQSNDPLSRSRLEIVLSTGARADRAKNSIHEEVVLVILKKGESIFDEDPRLPAGRIYCRATIETGFPGFTNLAGEYFDSPEKAKKWAKSSYKGVYEVIDAVKNDSIGYEISLSRRITEPEELAQAHGDRVSTWISEIENFLSFGKEEQEEN